MEHLQPISDTEQTAFCMELTKRLDMLRSQDHLCDVTLVTKDDKEFKAQRNVLSAASPFFFKLLQSDMKENREGIVRFEEISGAVMEDVLEWKRLADGLSERNCETKMMSYRDQLYAFPPYAKVERYDPVFNGWSTLDLQLSGTTRPAQVAVVRGEIYAIEVNTSTKNTTIKIYDIEECS